MSGDQTGALIERVKNKDFQALARLLTLLERQGPSCLALYPELLQTQHQAFRFGLTGPPGAGKSTLVGGLIAQLRAQGQTVGVMAVDPSSPFSKGAVLGDRIRYTEHFEDPGVFIRSLGTRGSLGGLSASAYLMLRAFDLAQFDFVLIETVGVGQTELEVINVADYVGVVLVPESGDGIQGMKAGLLEIANLFVVNKSDRPGAQSFQRELETALHLSSDPTARAAIVLATVATQGLGISEVLKQVWSESQQPLWRERRGAASRLQAEARALMREQLEQEIILKTKNIQSVQQLAQIFSSAKLSGVSGEKNGF
jgi:LAO/AO transport system kinase